MVLRVHGRSPRLLVLALAILAVVGILVAVAAILTLRGGGGETAASEPAPVLAGAEETQALLEGIPQDGTVLGEPDAPVTLVEYADLQCPFCAQWAVGTFPDLVAEYVRPGRLKIEYRGMAFIGPDSETALRTALAAAEQDRLWHVVEFLYQNQGGENTGWVTDDLVRAIAASTPGLDGDRLLADRETGAMGDRIRELSDEASAQGIRSTPSFLIGRSDGDLERLEVPDLGAEPFREAIDRLLGG